MQVRNFEIFEHQARLCGMMAHAKRLAMVEILKRGELSVGEIASALDCSISVASQHLRRMREENVVVARKDGQTVYYRLRNRKITACCHAIRELLIEDLAARGRLAADFDPDHLVTD